MLTSTTECFGGSSHGDGNRLARTIASTMDQQIDTYIVATLVFTAKA